MVNMFKSIKRLHFLKGLPNDGIIFSSGSSNWIQIFRKFSGLVEKKDDLGEREDDLSFTEFLRQRQEEARRSIIIQITNQTLWDKIKKLCNDCGYINQVFQYRGQNSPYVLIEMASEDKLHQFLKEDCEIQSNSGVFNQFLKLKEPIIGEPDSSKKIVETYFDIPVTKNIKSVPKSQDNVSSGFYKMYSDLSLDELGVRLRFLMCRQMETFCAGFFPNTIAYPFGSSVTGFGVNGCDLDISLMPFAAPTSYFHQENYLHSHKITVQEHITVIAELMKLFLVGCSGLTLIRSAKVPIVKYTNVFTNVDCDLSLYNMHGVAMSQLLYTMSLIDYRVRPLIIALKFWASNTRVVNKIPGKTLSNFQLSLLAIFFFQQISVLPPASSFPSQDGFLFDDVSLKTTLNTFKLKAKENKKSLVELYNLFFSFYSGFDFRKNGICIRSGKVIKNYRRSPLYIENPLSKGVNVSSNVDAEEIQKFHFTINNICNKAHKPGSAMYLQNTIKQSIV